MSQCGKNGVIVMDGRAEYRKIEVGETLISDIDFNRFNGSKGIRFWLDKDVAIRSAYYMSEP